ncbi:MAG: class I SAM-dependent methyltransferase [Ktedonobacteraceae bacterium]|nr:class I SAM-dependent methyltransferase [Ktedonobacteraceae bacterium]
MDDLRRLIALCKAVYEGFNGMNEYDLIAPFYDVEHAHFSEDLDMYINFAGLCGGNVLELACGSGRVLLPLAEEGYEVTGVDSSAAMLDIARQRLREEGLLECCTLVQQDMRDLHLDQKFRMAIIALGSFAHITTRTDQQKVLANIRAHLSPGGLFILDISNADARYMEELSGQLLHQGSWQTGQDSVLTHFVSPASSSDRHLLELTHFYDQHRQGGPVERTVITSHLYLFERGEIELLLEQAGFAMKDIYGDHELGPYHLESQRLICVAEAK